MPITYASRGSTHAHCEFYYKLPRGACISAVFAVARGVCLSVTSVYCIQTAEDIVKLFPPSGSAIILVFDPGR